MLTFHIPFTGILIKIKKRKNEIKYLSPGMMLQRSHPTSLGTGNCRDFLDTEETLLIGRGSLNGETRPMHIFFFSRYSVKLMRLDDVVADKTLTSTRVGLSLWRTRAARADASVQCLQPVSSCNTACGVSNRSNRRDEMGSIAYAAATASDIAHVY